MTNRNNVFSESSLMISAQLARNISELRAADGNIPTTRPLLIIIDASDTRSGFDEHTAAMIASEFSEFPLYNLNEFLINRPTTPAAVIYDANVSVADILNSTKQFNYYNIHISRLNETPVPDLGGVSVDENFNYIVFTEDDLVNLDFGDIATAIRQFYQQQAYLSVRTPTDSSTIQNPQILSMLSQLGHLIDQYSEINGVGFVSNFHLNEFCSAMMKAKDELVILDSRIKSGTIYR